ncbi:uncharacterized protein LOC113747570 [Larimichthys crocea]|uniref:uncharacterized protein LOC113747570 n=1 Tax=Larimichthys crocea TaxID=215358 RepID=UPI000F5D7164|nr:uncharacterized protein LOC113747570 [Larimichthys crocea]
MQWTVQVIVVLLNIAWIAFFLQPDPFLVFVQRRSSDSSDEEMLFRQFCIQPHPDMNWASTAHSANITSNKTNSTKTTAEEKTKLSLHEAHVINKTETHDCQCNNTHMKQSDYSGFSDIKFRAPAPGCKPMIIMTFPNKKVCVDVETFFSVFESLASDWDETTPAPSTAQRLTSSEVTTASGFISSSSSEAAHVTVTRQSKPPVQEKDNEDPTRSPGLTNCCVTVSRMEIPFHTIKGFMVQQRFGVCVTAIIFFTNDGQIFCTYVRAPWVRKALIRLHKINKAREQAEGKVETTSATVE